MWHTYSSITQYPKQTKQNKNHKILSFATSCMELEGIMQRERTQSEKDNYHYDFTNMWNLRYKTELAQGKGEKNKRQKQRGRQTIRNTES